MGFAIAERSWSREEIDRLAKHPAKRVFSSFIEDLPDYRLSAPIRIVVEKDSDGVTVTTPDLPLYGYGDDLEEALANLKIEIQSLYEDLMKDDKFSEDWFPVKNFLRRVVQSR